jgi:excisionase family DNA binding protein
MDVSRDFAMARFRRSRCHGARVHLDNLRVAQVNSMLRYLTVAEAAEVAGVSVTTIYRLIEIGVLTVSRPSPMKIRILEASIRDYLSRSTDPEFWTKEKRKALYAIIKPAKK